MSKGSSPAGNVTTTQGPPQYEYPYIGTALNQAGGLLASGGPAYYPGQQVAPFSPIQEQAFTNTNNMDNALTQGSGNPFENSMFNQAALATQGQLASQFAGSGRNLDASMPLRSDQLNNLATNFYGNNYQNTVQNAMQAAQQQQQLGGQLQQQAQQNIGANQNLFNYYQAQPYQQLSQYEQFLQGITPGMQSSSPYFNNPTANALGTGMAGLGLYNGLSSAGLLGKGAGSAGSAGGAAGAAAGALAA